MHSLKIAKECNWGVAGPAKFNDLAKPAAKLACAAGAVTEFATIEHNGSDAFSRFDGYCTHARRKCGRAQPIFGWSRPGTSAMEYHGAECRQRVRVNTRFDLVDQ